jgi:hypothetical protein
MRAIKLATGGRGTVAGTGVAVGAIVGAGVAVAGEVGETVGDSVGTTEIAGLGVGDGVVTTGEAVRVRHTKTSATTIGISSKSQRGFNLVID